MKDLVEAINNVGANVVFCQKGIDETTQHFLAKYGIMAIRRVKHSDMEKLAKSTGAKIVNRIKTITEDDLGSADSIVEHKIGKDYMIFIENAKDLKAITIMIRGGSEQIIDDTERTLKNGLFVLKGLLEQPKIVGGGGSIEIELKKRLMDFAQKMSGKEQIPIESFADALEIIPKVLIQNSGRDPLNVPHRNSRNFRLCK